MRIERVVLLVACAGSSACFKHNVAVEPIEIKPIHVTVDVNVKVQRELDKFFDFEKPSEPEPSVPEKRGDR